MSLPVGTWTLTVRVDRPVEGCEINPHVYLYQKGEKGAPAPGQPKHSFEYRWLRGPERPVCANPDCPRAQSFSPIQWSKFARKGCSFSIQCVSCAKLRVPRHMSVFCTLQCFHDAWKVHKRIHNRGHRGGDGGEDPALDGEEETPPPPPADYLTADTSEEDWVEVCKERTYVPQGIDVGRCLKLEIRVLNPDTSMLLGPRVAETEPVLSAPPAPPPRPLVSVKNVAGLPGAAKLRVATYNVLAEIYATQQMYPYCDHWALSWNYRKNNLIRELKEIQADVIFLQEVQADHYNLHIMPELSDEGFEGVYKHKTREAMGSSGKVDGCAIFWRRSKLRLAEKVFLEFNDCARRQASDLPYHDQQQAFLQRLLKDNIAMAAILEVVGRQRPGRHGGNLVCMANTHLYSHPEFPDVKLWQTYQLVQWLEGLVLPSNMPLILCGDFNSEPTSAVYQFMSEQMVQLDHPDLATDAKEVVNHLLQHDPPLSHQLALKSAYSSLLGREPKHTNYTVGYVGVLDYIWYTMDHLRPLSVAAVPDEQELQATGEALPNSLYPSDHLILFSDMHFTGGGGLGGLGGGVLGDVKRMPPGVTMHLGGGGGTPSKAQGGVLRKDTRGIGR